MALPTGLTYTAPGSTDTHGGTITGATPATAQASTAYTVSVTDGDGDSDTLTVNIAPRQPQHLQGRQRLCGLARLAVGADGLAVAGRVGVRLVDRALGPCVPAPVDVAHDPGGGLGVPAARRRRLACGGDPHAG